MDTTDIRPMTTSLTERSEKNAGISTFVLNLCTFVSYAKVLNSE